MLIFHDLLSPCYEFLICPRFSVFASIYVRGAHVIVALMGTPRSHNVPKMGMMASSMSGLCTIFATFAIYPVAFPFL